MKKKLALLAVTAALATTLVGCTVSGTQSDINRQIAVSNELATNQATPTDIDYSLERYNLIKRAYWVNGQREKARAVSCPIEKPLGYIVLFTEAGAPVGNFVVDGKVTSLNSYLSPDYGREWISSTLGYYDKELADVDGSYGENDNGIFFFTPDGKYVEWTGIYLYSDIPFEVETMLNIGED